MKRHGWILLVAMLALAATLQAQPPKPHRAGAPTVQDGSFHSAALGRTMKYRVLLPAGYNTSTRRYPVLYLLHGLYGDYTNWDTLTHLEQDAGGYSFLIAMPDAGNSWYGNSLAAPADRYEDAIFGDFIAEIDAKFRTIHSGHARAIAGLSMGGYGAIKFALKHPQAFVFAGSLSGALDAARDLAERIAEYHDGLVGIYGPPGSPQRKASDVFSLVAEADATKVPYLFLACGADDQFLGPNREFAAQLSARHIRYEYRENPGGHGWAYWDRNLPDLLQAVDAAFAAAARHP